MPHVVFTIVLQVVLAALVGWAGSKAAQAADLTARQVAVIVHKAAQGEKIDFSGKDLSELDLAGIDFKSALLAKVNLYGTDLSDANLSGVNLAGGKLDRAIMTRANFKSANLEGVTILKPSVFTDPRFDLAESPSFVGANLRGSRIAARLDGTSFRSADLSGSKIGPFDMSVEGGLAPSSIMQSIDFTEANLSGSEVRNIDFTFSRFTRARLNGAVLVALDLTNTDFSGADLTGASFTKCTFKGANFSGAIGLETAKGLEGVTGLANVSSPNASGR